MGEVYRARDSKLKRDIAIKVLPDGFSQDAERLSRFQREAEVLASLNHQHIAAIYDLAEFGTSRFLVLELVEGETLAARIGRGPIPFEEGMAMAVQMTEALEAAHEKGITHRDFKPANIKITPRGTVKVLDFGLAKVLVGDTAGMGSSHLPTLTMGATKEGVIIGTAAYMSPEQARGKPLDKRTDIWAFGCVLYEMLSGRSAFGRETVSDTVAAILHLDPDWSALPEKLPAAIRRLLARCLEKDATRRLHDIADARIEIDEVLRGRITSSAPVPVITAEAPRSKTRKRGTALIMIVAAGLLVGLGALIDSMWAPGRNPTRPSPLARVMVGLPPAQTLEKGRFPSVALSPDGKQLVYAAATDGGRTKLYLRPLDELSARPIPSTDGANTPFFSPDGRWLAFYADGQLKKVSVAGGVPLTICETPTVWSATWGENDTIVFSTTQASSGLWLVPAAGGETIQVTTPKPEETHGYPQLLPGGTQVLFSIRRDNAWRLAILTLKTRDVQLLGNGRVIGEGAQYLPTGHLIYAQSGGLIATPFDPRKGDLDQPPVPLPERIEISRFGGTNFAFAATAGTLVYLPAGTIVTDRTLLRVNRDGRLAPLVEARAAYEYPSLSPDGRRLSVTISSAMGSDIWIFDLERGTRVRFTTGDNNGYPVWGPGGKLAFQSTAPGLLNLFFKPLDGSSDSQPLFKVADSNGASSVANLLPGTLPTISGSGPQFPGSWTPDGSAIAFHERKPNGERDIWVVSPGSDPVPFLLTPFDERLPRFSPDGKWLAYVSDEGGRNDVYVQPYPGPGAKWLVSTDGGTDPVWSKDGRELFYRRGDRMMVVTVEPKSEFAAGRPQQLFELRFDAGDNGTNYDVSSDGKWFVVTKSDQGVPPGELHLVLNWFSEVARQGQ